MVKIVWTELALEDLRSIYDYISRDSKVYAERVVDKIILRADQLENFPNSGRVVPEFEDVTIRELIQGNYRIIYKTSATQVSIIRIHHSARILK
ncbi:MAG: type II toxin-antitoxin system RelE/ParE family toxin [Bacteroidetes bacterium]|nr:type II toxin-antitoxin system RelE/ParE family toxin [Bacteroidota bacterium]